MTAGSLDGTRSSDRTRANAPTGLVAFLFTDIEGSSRLEQRIGTAAYASLRARHRTILRAALAHHGGIERGTEGDSFFVVFADAAEALAAAIEAQQGLAAEPWPDDSPIRVRMGLHAGEAYLSEGDYVGIEINRAARIQSAAHGGQIVVSDAIRTLLADTLSGDVRLADLGTHRLKDFEPFRLHQVIARGLPSEFPPLRSLESRIDTLPRQLTSFLGRAAEVADVRELLRSNRLLTLTGPAGTGKTRLAIAAAAAALDDFRDGAAWVGLAPINDAELVPIAIAKGLSVRDEGFVDLLDAIADRIATSELLLVLDNFEHVGAAAPFVATLLGRCPSLTVLVTSRAVLHLAGEREYSVLPLAVPDTTHLPPADELAGMESIALFVERARAVRPNFALTADNAATIAKICAHLDGLPLAIELAAARIRLLSPAAIASRLEQSLGLLAGGARDLPERQQTLRGAIAWSYDLLEPVEQVYFRGLSVFAGGWSLENAEAVCDPDRSLGIDVLEALGSLVDKSLVRRSDTAGEEPRFRMLQVIREYGLERLEEAGDFNACHDRHLAVFARLAERAEPELVGADARIWLDRLEVEHDNIRAALRWSLTAGHVETGLLFAGRLWRLWHLRGYLGEGLAMIDELLAGQAGQAHSPGRAKALNGAGGLAYWKNDFPTARRRYEEQLALNRELGDRAGLAEAHYNLGFLAAIPGDHDEALRQYEAALALWRETGDEVGIGGVLFGLALVQYLRRDYERADATALEAIAHAQRIRDGYREASALGIRIRTAIALGRLEVARETGGRALQLFAESGDPTGVAMVLDDMGVLALREGSAARALRMAGAAEAVRERIAAGAPPTLIQHGDYAAEARSALAPADADAEWAAGRTMTEETAVAYALERPVAAPAAGAGAPAAEAAAPATGAAGPATGAAGPATGAAAPATEGASRHDRPRRGMMAP
jgi:predicted ATPase/class 3 adenylate cyclase